MNDETRQALLRASLEAIERLHTGPAEGPACDLHLAVKAFLHAAASGRTFDAKDLLSDLFITFALAYVALSDARHGGPACRSCRQEEMFAFGQVVAQIEALMAECVRAPSELH